ncbi:E3 ubiquitin-protein ligase RNF26-like [Neocloeon triangulifer]|uniref:E3 ubiquitin-protein ligase RNF26-like n=1 Tax=Neocloeon triangulifer TaxID=2078957 RepID=UPI00286F1E31|nr:E3 ubiquitin-protein ligase RNF26-like [Neocloeon triangulifer]XP_059481697.1 E3 ubiquitin-protein ligase RNF26-like [Neocloeon triangulifer]XP_059481698.1 E3 ubiquitin-protein ligase RNF26-like [Neocloeon triangulifer]
MIAILEGLVKGIGAAANLTVEVLSLSYKCGALIVAAVAAVGRFALTCLSSLASLVSILYQDFCFFSCDLLSKVVDAVSLTASFFDGLFSVLRNAFLGVRNGFAAVFGSCADGLFSVLDLLVQAWEVVLQSVELLKWALVVVGQGFWFAVQLVPLCIIYLLYSALSLVVAIVAEVADQAHMAWTFCLGKAGAAANWCFVLLTDFTVEAFMGLASIFILSYWLHRRRTAIKSTAARALRWTALNTKMAARKMWCTLVQFLHMSRSGQTFRWRRPEDSDEEDVPLALRLRARKSVSPGNLKRQLLMEQEEKLCVVCLEKNKCVILMPCRHLCMCSDCSAVISNTTSACPICRTNFDRAVVVFM